jgi:hypothetical protein
LLSNYINLCEKGGIVCPMITHCYREHLYASLSDLYGSGHLPDSICAMALACKGLYAPFVKAEWVSPAEMAEIWRESWQLLPPEPHSLTRGRLWGTRGRSW